MEPSWPLNLHNEVSSGAPPSSAVCPVITQEYVRRQHITIRIRCNYSRTFSHLTRTNVHPPPQPNLHLVKQHQQRLGANEAAERRNNEFELRRKRWFTTTESCPRVDPAWGRVGGGVSKWGACRWRCLRVRTFPREGVLARAVWCAVELSVPVFDSWMIEADLLMRWRVGFPVDASASSPPQAPQARTDPPSASSARRSAVFCLGAPWNGP